MVAAAIRLVSRSSRFHRRRWRGGERRQRPRRRKADGPGARDRCNARATEAPVRTSSRPAALRGGWRGRHGGCSGSAGHFIELVHVAGPRQRGPDAKSSASECGTWSTTSTSLTIYRMRWDSSRRRRRAIQRAESSRVVGLPPSTQYVHDTHRADRVSRWKLLEFTGARPPATPARIQTRARRDAAARRGQRRGGGSSCAAEKVQSRAQPLIYRGNATLKVASARPDGLFIV